MDEAEFNHLRLVEAVLFAAAAPVSVEELGSRLGGGVDVRRLLIELQQHYASRGVHLVETAGKWGFRTAPDLALAVNTPVEVQRKLSRAALETLTIVAYHQPVTRAEIESIRGVATSKGTLDLLMDVGWVKPGRRRDVPGRPLTWVTTEAFLHHFGLASLRDLPGIDELRAVGLLDARQVLPNVAGSGAADEDGSDEDGSGGDGSDAGDAGGYDAEEVGADMEIAAGVPG
ncbi:MAG TPA: SMC-Scp complex subunit ScpB [Azospirillaceae bacterium]|nr:SMC-Scp complex subunit ScpB [Azospirillaceae bacterium]